ncbi:CoA ester lyase [Actinomadura sp. DC4]|uniref:HpcH/HpaI aldolase/citrate lyase family protein n=1 Tax=Actinomadura sp. DC4 TaxID=3055069 RepID=UPI0025AFEECC|nr:CoA ester lyase [Actinomadura sp. DC4]MDN3359432.1 CoA ester lyase [Actinomadura sp. DC4]
MPTLLYVPADRPGRVDKALRSRADVVVLDLEDAVAPAHKEAAREAVSLLIASPPRPLQVRVNDLRTPEGRADLAALGPLLTATEGVRLPKVESAGQVREAAASAPGAALHPLLESALGVERAYEIASAHPAVASIGLGEADLRADLGVADETALTWPRSRVVVAARAAGLPAPVQSVYADIADLEGLAISCRLGRSLGFRGRAAIHPAQLPVIAEAYRPDETELAAARRVLAAFASAEDTGAFALEDGGFVDAAVARQAERLLAEAGPEPPA